MNKNYCIFIYQMNTLNKNLFIAGFAIWLVILFSGCYNYHYSTSNNNANSTNINNHIAKIHKIFDYIKFDIYKAKEVEVNQNKMILEISKSNKIIYFLDNNNLCRTQTTSSGTEILAENIDKCFFYKNLSLPNLVTIAITFLPDSNAENSANLPFITSFSLRNFITE